MLQTRPAEFLSKIFTPLQLNPVEFTQLSRQEKNRVILSLIEFPWDTNWIREQFGEIPQGVDYSKHILEVLADIQAENGIYFQSRQNLNRDIRNKQAFITDIAKDIPSGYDYDRWNSYPVGEKYRELERLKDQNSRIERAKTFRDSYDAKMRGIAGERDVALAAIDRASSILRVSSCDCSISASTSCCMAVMRWYSLRCLRIRSAVSTSCCKAEVSAGAASAYSLAVPMSFSSLATAVSYFRW